MSLHDEYGITPEEFMQGVPDDPEMLNMQLSLLFHRCAADGRIRHESRGNGVKGGGLKLIADYSQAEQFAGSGATRRTRFMEQGSSGGHHSTSVSEAVLDKAGSDTHERSSDGQDATKTFSAETETVAKFELSARSATPSKLATPETGRLSANRKSNLRGSLSSTSRWATQLVESVWLETGRLISRPIVAHIAIGFVCGALIMLLAVLARQVYSSSRPKDPNPYGTVEPRDQQSGNQKSKNEQPKKPSQPVQDDNLNGPPIYVRRFMDVEICGNGIDDNGDGRADEPGCDWSLLPVRHKFYRELPVPELDDPRLLVLNGNGAAITADAAPGSESTFHVWRHLPADTQPEYLGQFVARSSIIVPPSPYRGTKAPWCEYRIAARYKGEDKWRRLRPGKPMWVEGDHPNTLTMTFVAEDSLNRSHDLVIKFRPLVPSQKFAGSQKLPPAHEEGLTD